MRVAEMVRRLVGGCSGVMHAARLGAVIRAVEGLVEGGRLSPATIGRSLPRSVRPKHGIKCVDRLLGNPHLARDRMFLLLAVAHRLLRGWTRPIILVDWTQAGSGTHQALVAAVPIGGRALPIYLEVHPQKKLGNGIVEKRFLSSLKAVVPAECRPIIVSDAGFKGPFFQAVRELGWDFLGRVRGTTKAISSAGHTVAKEDFYACASIVPTDMGQFGLFVRQRIPCRLIVVRKRRRPGPKRPPSACKEEREFRQAALDPWLLATSLAHEDAAAIADTYSKRMQIEETFRDTKSHRFGWSFGQVRLSTPQRTAALLLLAAIALVVLTLVGMAAERTGVHRAYQANTAKRRVLSFFSLACAIIRRGALETWSLDDMGIPTR